MDADLQNDPKDIPLLLAKLDEGYDVCSGWLKNYLDNILQHNLPNKKLISWFLKSLVFIFTIIVAC